MVKAKEQSSELFFVQVKKPAEVRKDILETLREVVETLHRFEKFKQMRHKKLEKIHHLGVLIKQANKILGNLKLKLPQTNLRATAARASPQSKAHRKKKKKMEASEEKQQKEPKKELTEVDRLENELSAIESKLKSLT
ncbi:hypothetical protein J4234_04870 [Candidatus Woesearchaeota archaeon]|nr:hypothetical protein [Candidatus Woesearchaeota archaeon]